MIVRHVLRDLARRKIRAAMGVLGVFCTLALLTAFHAGLESVAVSYVDLVSLQAGKADLLVRRPGADWFRPETFAEAEALGKIGAHPLLRGLAPRLVGVVPVSDRGGGMHFALGVGIDPARERELGIDGFDPWPDLGPDSCALSEALAERLAGGEPISVGGVSLRRAGTIRRQLVFPQHLRDFLVMDLETARRALNVPEGVHVLAGALRDPKAGYDARDLRASVQALKDAGEAVAERLGPDFAVSLPKAEVLSAFDSVSGPLRAFFGIFALAALAITALLVYSLVSVSAEERIREHAILRTLGARRRHVFGLVLAEAGVLCLLGVVPGGLAGILVARGILALAGRAMGGEAAIPLSLSGATLRLCLGAGAAVAVAGALWPAVRSTRRRIVDALDPLRRGQIADRPAGERGVSRPLLLGGLALSAISGVVFFLLPGAVVSADPSLIGAVALGLLAILLTGLAMIAAAAAPRVERLVLTAGGWIFGPAAELAARNLARHRRRNATTSLMFALSVSFVLFLASLVALFSRTALSFIDRRVGSDLRLSLGEAREPGLEAELRGIEGVERAARAIHLKGRSRRGTAYDVTASDLVGMRRLWVVPFGVDDGLAETLILPEVRFEEGDAGAFRRLEQDRGAAGDPPPAIVSLSLTRHLGVRRGDLMELTFHLGPKKVREWVRIEAVCPVMPGFHPAFRAREGNAQGSGLLLSMRTFERLTAEAPEEAFRGVCFVRAKGPPKEAADRIRDQMGLKHRLGVECAAEEKREAEALYWATQVLFAMLLGAAVAIALFGLVASMATAAIERRWEIGVLKAVGLRRGHLRRMFAAEAVALTVSSGLLGAGMGYLLAYLFVAQAAILMEIHIPFAAPWITFAAAFAVCILAGLAAAWLPTRRLLGRPVAEILRGS